MCLLGCVDNRVPLGQCEHGRYWADCGGDGPARVGCDEATGECRWFVGGETAAGHAESDCPAIDVCCHRTDGHPWGFEWWRPSGDIAARAGNDLWMLSVSRIGRDTPAGVPVVYDYSPTAPMRCANFICAAPRMRVDGSSLLITMGDEWSYDEIEVWTNSAGERRARAFRHRPGPWHGQPTPSCGPAVGAAFGAMDGVLHLSTDRLDEPAAIHGYLETYEVLAFF